MARVAGKPSITFRARRRLPRIRAPRLAVPLSRLAWLVAGVTSIVWAPEVWLQAVLIFGSFVIVYLAGLHDGRLDFLLDSLRNRRDDRGPRPTPPDGPGA